MKPMVLFLFSAFSVLIVISACQTETDRTYDTRWAGETMGEIIDNIEDQFGGFDQTMMETNYRYNELYWAGMDENWGYAEYHLDKILSSMHKGFVRRPAREASSAQFVNTVAPQLMETIETGNSELFVERFVRLAASCNTCHEMEDVAFIQVIIPEKRTSLVKF